MKTFKKILFWTTSPVCMLCFILFMVLEWVSERCQHFLRMYEAWCFDYKKHWVYLGDGIWKGKDDSK